MLRTAAAVKLAENALALIIRNAGSRIPDFDAQIPAAGATVAGELQTGRLVFIYRLEPNDLGSTVESADLISVVVTLTGNAGAGGDQPCRQGHVRGLIEIGFPRARLQVVEFLRKANRKVQSC